MYFKRVFELTVKDNTHFLYLPSFFLPLKLSTSLWVSELDCLLLSWSALSYIKHVSHGDEQTTTILFPAHKHNLDPKFKLTTMRHMELTYIYVGTSSCSTGCSGIPLEEYGSLCIRELLIHFCFQIITTTVGHILVFKPLDFFFNIKLCKLVVQLGTGCNMQYYINYDLSIFTCTDKLKIFILCMIFCCCQSCHYYDLLKSVITSLR